jgi:hypothetical protein
MAMLVGSQSALAQNPEARGKYLNTIMGCSDCHTPFKMGPKGPEPDLTRLLSGHPQAMKMGPVKATGDKNWVWHGAATNTAFAGPWGVSYAANLTPDDKTGIGSWTEENFITALRTGKHHGVGRPIMPPMPWEGIGKATDEDLKALYAYFRSIPKIENLVPEYQPPAAPPAPAKKGTK